MTRFENRSLPGTPFEDPSRRWSYVGAPSPGAQPSRPGSRPPMDGPVGGPEFHASSEPEFDVVAVIERRRTVHLRECLGRASVRLRRSSDAIGLDAFGLFDSFSVEPVRALFEDLVARRRLTVSLEMQHPPGRRESRSTSTSWR